MSIPDLSGGPALSVSVAASEATLDSNSMIATDLMREAPIPRLNVHIISDRYLSSRILISKRSPDQFGKDRLS
jgi:hypothetical protein